MFGRGRERVDGTVVAAAVHRSHVTGEGASYQRMKYVVEYHLPDAAPTRVEVKETERFGATVMRSLHKGEVAPLLVDRRSGKVRFDVEDPRINLEAMVSRRRRRERDEFRDALGD